MSRIEREKNIVGWMITFYCRKKHQNRDPLCNECKELLTYAKTKLENCPYGEKKRSCKRCPTGCYTTPMRIKIKKVMGYSGPRIIFYKPNECIKHFFR